MVSQAAMRSQRVESECRCWSPVVCLLVTLLGSLVLVAVSVLLRLGDMKISRRDVSTANGEQTPVETRFPVRLVNGRNRCEGRVEVFYNDFWGTVCDDDWDMVDANVVCRQMGCGVAMIVGSSSQFGQGSGLILLDNVDCKGSEEDLSKCRSLGWGIHNCYHYEDVAVICREPAVVGGFDDRVTSPQGNFGLRDGTIRLVDGKHDCQGRVEIYFKGNWGTVCDDDWYLPNAQVVCRQTNCGRAVYAHTNSYFGYGTGRILLDNVHCSGHESDLTKCRSLGWESHNCGHHEDAGVTCLGSTVVTPVPTSNRRIIWPTTNTEAPATETVPFTESPTEPTTIATTPATTKGKLPAIRVMNGNSSCQGRVEVFYRNLWGTVCDDDWAMTNAHVVCRQLGCGHAIEAKSKAYFGYGSTPILLDNVVCSGSEVELTDCFHLGWGQHNCGHHEDAGVICAPASHLLIPSGRDFRETERIPAPTTAAPTTIPSEGTVRLANGTHNCEGRVEMYLNSGWGTVCDDAWDLPDAQVVCRQMGCGEATAARGEAFFGPGTGSILLDNLKCTGAESSLQDCSHISWNVHNCDHSEDASVTCSLS